MNKYLECEIANKFVPFTKFIWVCDFFWRYHEYSVDLFLFFSLDDLLTTDQCKYFCFYHIIYMYWKYSIDWLWFSFSDYSLEKPYGELI